METFSSSFCIIIMCLLFVGIGNCETNPLLINCGTNSSVDFDGRVWVGDINPNQNLTLSSLGITATAPFSGGSIYRTARFFENGLNYTFLGNNGSYFIRLHFYPFSFENYSVNESSFGIKVNGLKLVSEFNVPLELLHSNLTNSSLCKEYFITLDSEVLVLEFLPIEGSFGFINAIEIIPIGGKLFGEWVSKVGVNANSAINLMDKGIETMYRLNVGGPEIKPNSDFDIWRTWEPDSSYMIMADAGLEISNSSNITYSSVNHTLGAPLLVYESARTMSNTEVLEKRLNMSWKFKVDPDFDYLIRLHFCELVYDKTNQRDFRIYVNNRTANDHFDVFTRAGGMNRAFYQDYIDVVSRETNTLWVQLGPDPAAGASGTDALLNGLEIFKLSRNHNLARLSVGFNSNWNSSHGKSTGIRILWVGVGSSVVFLVILGVLFGFIFWVCRNRKMKKTTKKKDSPEWVVNKTANPKLSPGSRNLTGSMASTRVGKRFSLAEIRGATNNFDESLVLGVGGFGKVYKGEIEEEGIPTLAAIKRAHPRSQQGLAEFETEIDMLSKLRHRHLVSMIGFCEEQNEMILVYEYMANGTLRSHLFGTDLPPLDWKKRLEICIGAARGLHYLHTGADHGIIHRDVKTTNILLDEKFVAKMADFGLSKTGPDLENTHVSTAVKGSFGYLDPEYFRRQQLTEKSDVYSLGVVLFEVVCARPVINPSLPKDQINLAEWAMRFQRQRSLKSVIDPHLKGTYCVESMRKFGEIAEKCLADEGKNRPTMGEVLWHLEYVLQLHEAWIHGGKGKGSVSGGVKEELERGFAGTSRGR